MTKGPRGMFGVGEFIAPEASPTSLPILLVIFHLVIMPYQFNCVRVISSVWVKSMGGVVAVADSGHGVASLSESDMVVVL